MHEVPDTEEVDAEAEEYWPEGIKRQIRREISGTSASFWSEHGYFQNAYLERFSSKYDEYDEFLQELDRLVVIGAENGVDESIYSIMISLGNKAPIPSPCPYHSYLSPRPFCQKKLASIYDVAFREYSEEHLLEHIHDDSYRTAYKSWEDFIETISRYLTTGATNGADRMLVRVYSALALRLPLPRGRRYPRIMKLIG